MARIYLDHNATTPLSPAARDAIVHALDVLGNPSSIHEEGRRARDLVQRARMDVAALIGAAPEEIVFTSGGTEADALGIVGGARAARAAGRPPRIVTSPLEHPAARGAAEALAAEGFEVVRVPVDARGRVDPDDVARALAPGAALACFALANHEIGNLYDVAIFAAAARAAGALLFCDAVQAAGRRPLDVRALGADLVALSAHKLGGPKGVGALWVRRGVVLEPLVLAGHQERGLRPGTENLLGIVGFGAAARAALAGRAARTCDGGGTSAATASGMGRGRGGGMGEDPRINAKDPVAARRDRLEEACLSIPGGRVHGDPAARVANTTNVGFEGAPGDLVVAALDLEGVSASTGAACSSGRVEPSPVLRALGLPPERAAEGVRFSLGPDTTDEEIDRVIALLPPLIRRIRARAG